MIKTKDTEKRIITLTPSDELPWMARGLVWVHQKNSVAAWLLDGAIFGTVIISWIISLYKLVGLLWYTR